MAYYNGLKILGMIHDGGVTQAELASELLKKQDVLIAGDGIKIEGNVISAIGGGSSEGGNVVNYSLSGISFTVTLPTAVSSMEQLGEALFNGGYDYPGSTYEVTNCYANGSLLQSAGLYSTDGTEIYLYEPYGSFETRLENSGFSFGGN